MIFFFSFFFGIRAVSVSLLLLLWRRGLGTNEGRKIRTKIPKEKITSYSSCKRERDEDEVWKKGEWIDDEAGRNSEGICIECDFFSVSSRHRHHIISFPWELRVAMQISFAFLHTPELHYASLKWLVFLLMLLPAVVRLVVCMERVLVVNAWDDRRRRSSCERWRANLICVWELIFLHFECESVALLIC